VDNLNNKLIGSVFGFVELSDVKGEYPPFITENSLFLSNARSGINLLAKVLKPKVIWMPSFLCDVMLKSVEQFEVKFYEVDIRLNPLHNWLDKIQKGDLVVIIDYFGFRLDPSLFQSIKDRGGWILEDASQALLSSHVGTISDFVLFSPRKFLSVPDGGILRNNTVINFSEIQLTNVPAVWWLKALSASLLRREYDLHGGEKKWFKIFQETDIDSPIGQYAMSELSKILLENSFDYSSIIQRRRDNYQVLNSYLSKVALFPELPPDVVPLGYPIRVLNRDFVRETLFDDNIYCPIHWPIADIVPPKFGESHYLAETILTLVCDQRYSPNEMERMAKIVLREAKG
jgi:dTDP-4-amino-4,6-dideoxygalactose transaminase